MEELLFSGENILERVDEYTLYCSYLDFEPLIGARYQSPIRAALDKAADENPSFGLFVPTRAMKNYGSGQYPNEFLWTDQALGITGDIFELVRRLCRLGSRRDAMRQVMIDSGLLPGDKSRPIIDIREKRFQGYSRIQIANNESMNWQELKYWQQGNINQKLLAQYFCTSFRMYWLYEEQQYPRFSARGSFAYRIWDKYQLYFTQTEHRQDRFRTDWTEVCVPGFLQLQYNADTLIITKSMKDVMLLRSFGYEAISPRGENIMLPVECIAMMKRKYRKILVLFDNDMKHKGDSYEFEKIYVPKEKDSDKDPFDYCTNHGASATGMMLKKIIHYD